MEDSIGKIIRKSKKIKIGKAEQTNLRGTTEIWKGFCTLRKDVDVWGPR